MDASEESLGQVWNWVTLTYLCSYILGHSWYFDTYILWISDNCTKWTIIIRLIGTVIKFTLVCISIHWPNMYILAVCKYACIFRIVSIQGPVLWSLPNYSPRWLHQFLDIWLGKASSPEESHRQAMVMVQLVRSLGWVDILKCWYSMKEFIFFSFSPVPPPPSILFQY